MLVGPRFRAHGRVFLNTSPTYWGGERKEDGPCCLCACTHLTPGLRGIDPAEL